MSNKKNLFSEAFEFKNILEETYIISITEQDRKCLSQTNRDTALKIVESPCFQKLQESDGSEYFAIVMPKRYGLVNAETHTVQKGLSDKAFAEMYELTAELLELGFKENEVNEIITNPKNYHRLDDTQKAKAYKFLSLALNNQASELDGLTALLKTRVNAKWTDKDTLALPESLTKELLEFLVNEREQWINSSESPKSEEQSTITEGALVA